MKKMEHDERKKTKRAVFSLEIDFNSEAEDHNGKLKPGRRYGFPGWSKRADYYSSPSEQLDYERGTSYNDIVDYVVDIINSELQPRFEECIDIPIEKVTVIGTYRGSIKVLFSVIFNVLGVVSGLKDLYDCIELIKEISRAHIKERMDDNYGELFDIYVRTLVPNERRLFHLDESHIGDESVGIVPPTHKSRDAFFYYLLISNIVLLIIIVLLVYKAVLTMYW